MRYAETILDTIGNTPLVRLNRVTEGIAATVLVKVEYLNPGGSSKDRIAVRMIDAAERDGLLKPGGTIVEPTSGNTGVALAMVAQQRGYRCVFVCPDKVGEEKRDVLRAYGAEVVVTPTAVAPDSEDSYYSVSDRLAAEIPGAFKPNQYFNENGPLSHYETTGPEIWRDTEGKLTHFVAGVGTGGTISGTGRYLKEVSNGSVKVVGADPEGSIYSGGAGRPYLVEGVGEDFMPGAYDPSVVDEVIAVDDAESFAMTRRLAAEEGLLVGGSSGMAVAVALRAARDLPEDAVMVVLLPDSGRGYLAKVFNDNWMGTQGFGDSSDADSVLDVLQLKSGGELEIIYALADDSVRTAIERMRDHNVWQMPVLSEDMPAVIGEVLGSVTLDTLLAAVAEAGDRLDAEVRDFMVSPLRQIGIVDSVAALTEKLETHQAVLVVDRGKPVGLLTNLDLLTYRAGV